MRRIRPACALCFVVTLLTLAPAHAAEFYRLPGHLAGAVSPDGSLVLTTGDVWTPSGGFVPFSPGTYIYSRDISNNGVVVGLIDGSYIASRTPIGGPVQELGAFPGGEGYGDAFAITPDGRVVVGYASSPTGPQAFRWTPETGLVGLGHLVTPGDHFSDSAYGVSADGAVVVGQAESAAGQQAFRWTTDAGMVSLGDLPGGEILSSARGISADGQVIVGFSSSANGTEAFRWTQSTGMLGLGDLPGGLFYSSAYAATADGSVIVGESRDTLIDSEAFVWTADHGMRSLQDVLATDHGLGPALAGWQLFGAGDISDDGRVIVGYGRNPEGALEGFVVIVPEPCALAFAVTIAGPLALRRRRVRSRQSMRMVAP